jgi:hypothetical protein
MYVGGIFYDLAKAFDVMNHAILLANLNSCGIDEYLKIGSGPI